MGRTIRIGTLSAVVVWSWLLMGSPARAGEVDILSISHDFQSLPRSLVVVGSVPQPPKSGGKLAIADDLGRIMTEELVAAIQRAIPTAKVLPASADASDQQALLLDCHFSKLVAGSRAKRFWVGFGAGKSVLEVSGEIRERATGRVVGRFTHARLSWCCGFGSNNTEIRDNLVLAAEDIASIVAGRLEAKQSYEWLPDNAPSIAAAGVVPVSPPVSTLLIDSSGAHAEVEIDGKFVGTTPLEVQVSAGSHTVAVRKEDFGAWSRSIDVLIGSKQNLWAELNAQAK